MSKSKQYYHELMCKAYEEYIAMLHESGVPLWQAEEMGSFNPLSFMPTEADIMALEQIESFKQQDEEFKKELQSLPIGDKYVWNVFDIDNQTIVEYIRRVGEDLYQWDDGTTFSLEG